MIHLSELTKEELIDKVNTLTLLLDAIQNEKRQSELLNFPWVGNLGNWYWHVKSNQVIFNDQKIIALGYSKKELGEDVGFEFFTKKLHPEDYERVMQNMRDHLYGKVPVYECSYRIQRKDGTWVWFYDRGMVTNRDENGKPELVSGIVFDITEQKRMEASLVEQNQKLENISRTDFLTDLNNRRALFERLEYEMKRVARTKEPLSILMLDIDHFKKVNDSYGHLTGDGVLIEVAKKIKSSIRVTDIPGRYGGEEFMVILPSCDELGAMRVAESVRMSIQDTEFDNGIKITISGGIKQYENESVDGLIEAADQNLYLAKKNGRNKIVHST